MKTKVLCIVVVLLCFASRVSAQDERQGEPIRYQFGIFDWTTTPKRYVFPLAKVDKGPNSFEVRGQVTYNFDEKNNRYERAELALFVTPLHNAKNSVASAMNNKKFNSLKQYQSHNTVITQELFRLSGTETHFEGEAEIYTHTFGDARPSKNDRMKLKYSVFFDPTNPSYYNVRYDIVHGDWEQCNAIVQMPRLMDNIWSSSVYTSQLLPDSIVGNDGKYKNSYITTYLFMREYTPDGALWRCDGGVAPNFPKHLYGTINISALASGATSSVSERLMTPWHDITYDSIDDTYTTYMSKSGSDQLVIKRLVPIQTSVPAYLGRRESFMELYIRVKFRNSSRIVDGKMKHFLLPAQSVFTSEVIVPYD